MKLRVATSTGGLPVRRPASFVAVKAPLRAAAKPGARPSLFSGVPLPVVLLLLSFLCPRELEFTVGVALTPQRILLLCLVPLAAARLAQSRVIRLQAFDALIIGAFCYYWFALFQKETLSSAIQSGGSQFLEAVGGYVVGRAFVLTEAQLRATIRLLLAGALLLGVVAAIESIFHVHWIKILAARLTGATPLTLTDTRLGLLRAAATFDHPIHYGTFGAVCFGLCTFVDGPPSRRYLTMAALAVATFFSLTSAAFLGLGMVMAGAIWEWTTRHVPHRAKLTVGLVIVLLLAASLLTERSIGRILSTSLTLDPGNAYYRLAIWEYGTANVYSSPWFGVPLGNDWARPDWMYSGSIDNYWLATAMWGGVPTLVLYMAGIFTLLRRVNRYAEASSKDLARGWNTAVLVLFFAGTTVHFWREFEVFFTFCLGLGGMLAQRPPAQSMHNARRSF